MKKDVLWMNSANLTIFVGFVDGWKIFEVLNVDRCF